MSVPPINLKLSKILSIQHFFASLEILSRNVKKDTFPWTHITEIQILLNKGYSIASIRLYMTANLISAKLINGRPTKD